jgi:hypothetical protein
MERAAKHKAASDSAREMMLFFKFEKAAVEEHRRRDSAARVQSTLRC